MVEIPQSFKDRMDKQLEGRAEAFYQSLDLPASTAIRLNKAKEGSEVLSDVDKSVIPWSHHALQLKSRPSFTLDPDFHAGRYYVQESSSMVLYHVLTQLFKNDKAELKMLDLCGAPGGKSTTILDFLGGEGSLITNEVIQNRVRPLIDNIMKWGYNNTIVTNNDPSAFARFHGLKFDCIVVDAPCSGEGMFRKDPKAISEWSEEHVHHCAVRQRRILQDISQSLKENGYLIYSTCTYNEAENIDNVAWAAQEFDLDHITIEMDSNWGIETIKKGDAVGYQFYPHNVSGEGFFIAILKSKTGSDDYQKVIPKLRSPERSEMTIIEDWIDTDNIQIGIANNNDVYVYNDPTFELINLVIGDLKVRYSGVKLGTINKSIIIPDHALALSHTLNIKSNRVELSKEDAITFLRKDLAKIDSDKRGWILLTYNGFGLGWIKNLGNRINNYLPNEWRIRMASS